VSSKIRPAPHSMESVADSRHEQALRVWLFWKRLPEASSANDWTYEEFKKHEKDVLTKLAELCLPEIGEAFQEVGLDRFSKTNTSIASAAIYRAAETLTETKRPVHEHIKACVKEALEAHIRAFDEWFYQAKAEQLLQFLLGLSRPAVVAIGQHLNRQQRSGLRQLLFKELGNKPMLLRLDREPSEQRRWLYWYLWRSEMTQPAAKQLLGGVPRHLFVGDGDALPASKQTGKPLDPLGPIHAKAWEQLGVEINKHGTAKINHPYSRSRIARSLGVDRSTVDRYLRANIGREPIPDGKRGVTYQFTSEDVLRAMEEVMRKRGPRPSGC